ncbi:DUF3105 domain-containing protein [Microbacteriaceae bacterium VKM Ac-2855]|nr:DUF3105 domain-containing protein [Microbacteriaceae bacterium VKM Ac-2855]
MPNSSTPKSPSGSDRPNGSGPTSAKNRARLEKVEAFRREEAKKAQKRRLTTWILSGVAVLAVGAIATVVIIGNGQIAAQKEADSAPIEGVETFDNTANHVTGTVDYAQTPPAGGDHNAYWLNCGVYTEPVPSENAVHDLEHGAIWATYDPSLPQSEIDALIAELPDTYVTVSPFEGLPSPIVLSAWNAQLQIDSPDDSRVSAFVTQYWQSGTAPEIGAACTGGVDAPGKL